MRNVVESISDLFTTKIWSINMNECSKPYARLVRLVKIIRITFSTFLRNKMGFQCVALSYFITLATVPFLAVLFAITGEVHLNDIVAEVLIKNIPDQKELITLLMEKANIIIDSAKGGGLGAVSAFFFIWTILWMMFQVERVFNNVWGIRNIPRKIYTRFGFYLLVLLLSPFIVIIFGTGITYYSNVTDLIVGLDLSDLRLIQKILGYLIFYSVITLTLSAMYKFIPATRVEYRHALKAAAIDALFFLIFQYIYLNTQIFVARLNQVYGVVAAIPLYLIWLNFSWQIIIYGAELTYSFQNVDKYNLTAWGQ